MKRVLSLFSGCGGMDLGFEGGFVTCAKSINGDDGWLTVPETSFKTVFANDIRRDAQRAWQRYFSRQRNVDGIYHLDSIVDLIERQRNGENVFPDHIDVVTGGFPCQDFSTAGKRRGFSSERGRLYKSMKTVIEMVRPKVFVAENVKGLMTLDDSLDVICRDFASSGYIVRHKLLRAWEYGVPESRERVIFIGVRRDALQCDDIDTIDFFPPVTHGDRLLPLVACRDVLSHLREPQDEHDDLSQMSYSEAKYLGRGRQGQTEIRWDGLGPTIRSEHHGNIEYRRLSAEHGGLMTEELERGLSERRLTPRECALIQTFPPDYEFVISDAAERVSRSDAYKIIGNAVPPVLAYNIARHLDDIWLALFGTS